MTLRNFRLLWVILPCLLAGCGDANIFSPREAAAIQFYIDGDVLGPLINFEMDRLKKTQWKDGIAEADRVAANFPRLLETGMTSEFRKNDYTTLSIARDGRTGYVLAGPLAENNRKNHKPYAFKVKKSDGEWRLVNGAFLPDWNIFGRNPKDQIRVYEKIFPAKQD